MKKILLFIICIYLPYIVIGQDSSVEFCKINVIVSEKSETDSKRSIELEALSDDVYIRKPNSQDNKYYVYVTSRNIEFVAETSDNYVLQLWDHNQYAACFSQNNKQSEGVKDLDNTHRLTEERRDWIVLKQELSHVTDAELKIGHDTDKTFNNISLKVRYCQPYSCSNEHDIRLNMSYVPEKSDPEDSIKIDTTMSCKQFGKQDTLKLKGNHVLNQIVLNRRTKDAQPYFVYDSIKVCNADSVYFESIIADDIIFPREESFDLANLNLPEGDSKIVISCTELTKIGPRPAEIVIPITVVPDDNGMPLWKLCAIIGGLLLFVVSFYLIRRRIKRSIFRNESVGKCINSYIGIKENTKGIYILFYDILWERAWSSVCEKSKNPHEFKKELWLSYEYVGKDIKEYISTLSTEHAGINNDELLSVVTKIYEYNTKSAFDGLDLNVVDKIWKEHISSWNKCLNEKKQIQNSDSFVTGLCEYVDRDCIKKSYYDDLKKLLNITDAKLDLEKLKNAISPLLPPNKHSGEIKGHGSSGDQEQLLEPLKDHNEITDDDVLDVYKDAIFKIWEHLELGDMPDDKTGLFQSFKDRLGEVRVKDNSVSELHDQDVKEKLQDICNHLQLGELPEDGDIYEAFELGVGNYLKSKNDDSNRNQLKEITSKLNLICKKHNNAKLDSNLDLDIALDSWLTQLIGDKRSELNEQITTLCNDLKLGELPSEGDEFAALRDLISKYVKDAKDKAKRGEKTTFFKKLGEICKCFNGVELSSDGDLFDTFKNWLNDFVDKTKTDQQNDARAKLAVISRDLGLEDLAANEDIYNNFRSNVDSLIKQKEEDAKKDAVIEQNKLNNSNLNEVCKNLSLGELSLEGNVYENLAKVVDSSIKEGKQEAVDYQSSLIGYIKDTLLQRLDKNIVTLTTQMSMSPIQNKKYLNKSEEIKLDFRQLKKDVERKAWDQLNINDTIIKLQKLLVPYLDRKGWINTVLVFGAYAKVPELYQQLMKNGVDGRVVERLSSDIMALLGCVNISVVVPSVLASGCKGGFYTGENSLAKIDDYFEKINVKPEGRNANDKVVYDVLQIGYRIGDKEVQPVVFEEK